MLYEVMQNPELAGAASARILESLQSPVLVIDAGGEISYANATAAVSFGGWIVGLSLSEIFPDYLKTPTLGDGPSCMRLRSQQGELYEALFNPVGDGNICLSMWAISETAVFKEPVKIDDLTGLALRNTLMTNLEVALLEPDQAGASAAILCLDLDQFKLINDTLGHGISTMRAAFREWRRHRGGIRFSDPDLAIRLFASVPLSPADGEAGASFTLSAGESAWFVLGDDALPCPDNAAIDRTITATTAAWRGWLSHSTYKGRWREDVARSALALKLLTSRRHGSIAAAATFSLPEATGGERNWDYRATWIRDASFTVYAFMRLGFIEEAEQFNRWAADRVMAADADHPIRIMYALDGSEAADEQELAHLAGYAGSRPVRIGNAAHAQSQLDIFGELMDSVYLSNKYGRAISHRGWQHVCGIAGYVAEHWHEPDAGIWEMRSEPHHFLHSRVMCWVAMDRAIRLAEKRSLPAPLTMWAECRAAIAEDIWTNFRHPEHGYFVQERGGSTLDAALLMMPLVRFVSSTDPVWLKTLDAIGDQLRDDGMIYRYRGVDDGLQGTEGAFTTCTFWYAECLARAGRMDEAQLMLAKGLAYANSLGLFAEETDARGLPLGNFPQALTHLAFISAAYFIDGRLNPSYRPQWQP